MYRSLTVRLDEGTIRKAKVVAARRSTSVSRLVTDEIDRLVREDEAYEQARIEALGGGWSPAPDLGKPVDTGRHAGTCMTAEHTFVDTNVLLYAHDRSAGRKHDAERDLLVRAYGARVQARSARRCCRSSTSTRRGSCLSRCRPPAHALVVGAVCQVGRPPRRSRRHRRRVRAREAVSAVVLGRAGIVSAACCGRVTTLATEDLQHGRRFVDLISSSTGSGRIRSRSRGRSAPGRARLGRDLGLDRQGFGPGCRVALRQSGSTCRPGPGGWSARGW